MAQANGKMCKKRTPAISVKCGCTIGQGARVYLNQDLDCRADHKGPALIVEGPVTLDLKNHTIIGNGVDEVIVVTGNEARIQRGKVTGVSVGMLVAGEGNHRIVKTRAIENAEDGFVVDSGHNRLVFARALDNALNRVQYQRATKLVG